MYMGMELPAFLLEDAAGAQFTFPTQRRSLVCFVKEDCPTCREVMPVLDALHSSDSGGPLETRDHR